MGLQVYRKKRQFDVTSEPRGRQRRGKGNRFVIQKHDASRLHYDFRLELDGVMKSWAVTRGPSLNPQDKRLAVHVEDHPVEYNSFEGTIPKGQYGGGTVMIWDRGTWTAEGDPHKGYAKGHLAFELDGEKLHGKWHLVRMRGRGKEAKEPWLLIKSDDEWTRHGKAPDILEEEPRSVVTGRTIAEIAEGKGRKRVWQSNRSVKANVRAGATSGVSARAPRQSGRGPRRAVGAKNARAKGRAKKTKASGHARLPDFVPPSLATLSAKAPANDGWVHEVKFDGYRIQARLDHRNVRLLTRKGLDWAEKFPNVAQAVAELAADTALIDGEITVENEHGVASFSSLQADLRDDRTDRFVYYVFDLLHCDGRDLSRLPLVERKAALEKLIGKKGLGPIRYSEDFSGDGAAILQSACRLGLEGIVSKRADAPYRSGRSDAFLKIKCAIAQELVVGGYAPSNVVPNAVGALVVGYYENGGLHYAGRVGTGYTQKTAKDLWKRLNPLEIAKPPFADIPRAERRAAKWVEPKMVIEANLSGGWTTDGIVRQAAFKGVREDKPAKEVVREVPVMAKTDVKKSISKKSRPRPAVTAPAKSAKPASDGAVRFTHPDRVYWEDVGVTKQDLADYYRAAWELMAPQVANRPLAFLRCPDGTKGECFFQKHASAGLTDAHLRTVIDKKRRQVIAIADIGGLMSLVQAGILEIHVRGSTIEHLDRCDRIVFDLDPGEGVAWSGLVAAARDVRERLQGIGLESFVKLSGGKGLHVVLPIEGADWESAKTFAQALAMAMAADEPKRYVAKMTKSLRGGKIFIDYFRNSLEQTSVAVYSTRARAGAPVSAPVTWEELGRSKGANQYTVLNLAKRLASLKRDPWQEMGRVRQRLPDLKQLRKRG